MSIDYIGEDLTIATVRKHLAETGVAVIWFYDPRKYLRIGRCRIKEWHHVGETIRLQVNCIDPDHIISLFVNAGIGFKLLRFVLPDFENNVARQLYVGVLGDGTQTCLSSIIETALKLGCTPEYVHRNTGSHVLAKAPFRTIYTPSST